MNKAFSTIAGLIAGGHSSRAPGAMSFIAAILIAAAGSGMWLTNKVKQAPTTQTADNTVETESSMPVYVPVAASYAGGFLIGRIVRRFLKTVALLAALAAGAVAMSSRFGCDTKKISDTVKHETVLVKEKTGEAKDYLMHLLPSAGGGGAGVLIGARKGKRKPGDVVPA